MAELLHPFAPTSVRDWSRSRPAWVEVRNPKGSLVLEQLDLGESEAIMLATEIHADVMLIDEQAGREEAIRRGLKVAGSFPSSAKLTRLDCSISSRRSPNFKRRASAYHKPCWQKSERSGRADPGRGGKRLKLSLRAVQEAPIVSLWKKARIGAKGLNSRSSVFVHSGLV